MCVCDPNTEKVKTGESKVWDQPGLHAVPTQSTNQSINQSDTNDLLGSHDDWSYVYIFHLKNRACIL